VIGFAHTFTNRSVKLGPSVYWRAELGENYGGLGPIGVSKDYRKIGLGLALLSYGVWCVKQAGAALMAIDWTVLVDFYGRLGFQPWRRFTPYTKEISK
jgi:predicted N-acetyltransferase YhbS